MNTINNIISNANAILLFIPIALLSLDTIRALLAMTGWVKPTSKIAWIIYGRYDRNLIITALKDLGYDEDRSKYIIRDIQKRSQKYKANSGITETNAHYKLICLLCKYLKYFQAPIQYGGSKSTHSQYYIDTMEASHNNIDLSDLANIMSLLISKRISPQIIIVPKNGNPLLGQAVANLFDAKLLIAKSIDDNSHIRMSDGTNKQDYMHVNYEGSWALSDNSKNQSCILLDCNATSGTQLLDVLRDININQIELTPKMAFILFRIDNENYSIDAEFASLGCPLFRYFDLDEDLREMLYNIKTDSDCDRGVSHYYINDKRKIDDFIKAAKLKNKYKYYYDTIEL